MLPRRGETLPAPTAEALADDGTTWTTVRCLPRVNKTACEKATLPEDYA